MLNYHLCHEISHSLYSSKDQSYNEGVADDIATRRIINIDPAGEHLAAVHVSDMLVEANLLGFADIRNLEQIELSYEFSDKSLGLIQQELDAYHADKDKARQRYEKHQVETDYYRYTRSSPSNYSKGFIDLVVKKRD